MTEIHLHSVMDTLVMTPEIIADYIKRLDLLVRYGTREMIFIAIGALMLGLATWITKVDIDSLKSLVYLDLIIY